MARLFGTDGVRGVANEDLTPLMAMQLGQAGAYVLTKEKEHKPTTLESLFPRPTIPLKLTGLNSLTETATSCRMSWRTRLRRS